MQRGEAVPDPEDAEVAIRAVAQIEYVRRAMPPMIRVSMLLVVAFLVTGVVSGSTILIVIGALGVGSATVFGLFSRRQRARCSGVSHDPSCPRDSRSIAGLIEDPGLRAGRPPCRAGGSEV
jgi:hypothetical protein